MHLIPSLWFFLLRDDRRGMGVNWRLLYIFPVRSPHQPDRGEAKGRRKIFTMGILSLSSQTEWSPLTHLKGKKLSWQNKCLCFYTFSLFFSTSRLQGKENQIIVLQLPASVCELSSILAAQHLYPASTVWAVTLSKTASRNHPLYPGTPSQGSSSSSSSIVLSEKLRTCPVCLAAAAEKPLLKEESDLEFYS